MQFYLHFSSIIHVLYRHNISQRYTSNLQAPPKNFPRNFILGLLNVNNIICKSYTYPGIFRSISSPYGWLIVSKPFILLILSHDIKSHNPLASLLVAFLSTFVTSCDIRIRSYFGLETSAVSTNTTNHLKLIHTQALVMQTPPTPTPFDEASLVFSTASPTFYTYAHYISILIH